MAKEMTHLKFYFRNGETWTVERRTIGDLWIKQITTSFGRIGESDFQKIHPCGSFRIEVYPEADHVNTKDINLGGLEQGMFGRVRTYQDIEKMDIVFDTNDADTVYFPYKALDEDGMDNKYQSSVVASNGHLYIVVDSEKTVNDIYHV
ncbi:hypothetical protein KG091_00510 [Carnobacteriaceae bacterium zg-ZUI78]|uniref:hypothetical protein n=1 Tax=Granulicatella sp. zg-84 TaxID=2678503 RepID=UPI0013BF973C|nr:hypothetical protein [Granulicatella sp. zg-84]MBS4749549.1 hypothetical protein [Carnobacteriaceae bacterium zg-ZUI78]NEW65741.1 hypothetical protein [Granulicatella sp. zg-84]QMI86506.1 hypothetical protein H1220_03950 [Carnobacteriaceae bacterium zg-84]